MPDLRPLLSPDSVAIVGAAADERSLRGRLTRQLIEHGYDGRIYPVTRSQTEVLGYKAYPTIADIPEPADLAIILVPAAHVVSAIEQCGARGIPAAAIISSGFGEGKTEAAANRDAELRAAARHRADPRRPARAGTPLITATVGRSDAGRRAAASHTGALARAGMADDAIFRHHGIVRGEDLDHMVDVATAFAYCPLPRGNRVAIITGSGGSAVWMADILSAHGLELPVLEDDIQRRIMALLPSYGSAQNPIDATAQAIGEIGYAPLVELVRQSERIDTILLISSLANENRAKKLADEMAGIVATAEQPILLSTYTTASAAAITTLAGAGIPCYTSMPSCARAIKALVDYGRFREKLARRKPVE